MAWWSLKRWSEAGTKAETSWLEELAVYITLLLKVLWLKTQKKTMGTTHAEQVVQDEKTAHLIAA